MRVRPFDPDDTEAVVQLSLRAWAPVFESIRSVLGSALFRHYHPEGWRRSQAQAVEAALRGSRRTWIAEEDGVPCGFVTVDLRPEEGIGEIYMIAVDPDHQRAGVGKALTEHALREIEDAGLPVALVETGGDPGHVPARALYRSAGFVEFPIARFYRMM